MAMDVDKIFTTIEKGLLVANSLGSDAGPVLHALGNLINGAKAGTVTDEQLAETEALLDKMIAEFNQPM